MSYALHHHDAHCISSLLKPDSVDLIVTSPPYFGLRSYTDEGEHYEGQIGDEATPTEFLDSLIACTADWLDVLKPTGSLWVNLGDKYAGGGGHAPDAPSNVARREGGGSRLDGRFVVVPSTSKRQPAKPPRITADVPNKSLMGLPWRYALRCVDELGLIMRAEVIWHKANGMPESVTDRVRRSHEQWFHFTRQGRYFAAMDEIREPTKRDGLMWDERKAGGETMRAGLLSAQGIGNNAGMAPNPLGKVPGSVWSFANEPLIVPDSLGVDHFAAFPSEWPRRIILGWCPENGVVLDPFVGTGTTVAVAHLLGRHGIGTDLSKDYLRLAEWRCTEDRLLRDKVLDRSGIPNPLPPKIDGQLGFFE